MEVNHDFALLGDFPEDTNLLKTRSWISTYLNLLVGGLSTILLMLSLSYIKNATSI